MDLIKELNDIIEFIDYVSVEERQVNLHCKLRTVINRTPIFEIPGTEDFIIIIDSRYRVKDTKLLESKIRKLKTLSDGTVVPNCIDFDQYDDGSASFYFTGDKYEETYASLSFYVTDVTKLSDFVKSLSNVYELATHIHCSE